MAAHTTLNPTGSHSVWGQSMHLTASPEKNGLTIDISLVPRKAKFSSGDLKTHSRPQPASGIHYKCFNLRTSLQGPTADLDTCLRVVGPTLSTWQVKSRVAQGNLGSASVRLALPLLMQPLGMSGTGLEQLEHQSNPSVPPGFSH